MVEMNNWDEKMKTVYHNQQFKRYNVSHYVEDAMEKSRTEGRAEGRAEVISSLATKMLENGGNVYTNEMICLTGVSEETLRAAIVSVKCK